MASEGTDLASPRFCDQCGAGNSQEATTCFACGHPLQQTLSEEQVSDNKLRLDSLLKQRYRIIGLLGQGGFGAVYKAQDTEFANRLVAIKEMSRHHLSTKELQEATAAFKSEAQLLAGLTHPNLPRIYEQFSEENRWYLVMDFIEGETLDEYLSKKGLRYLPVPEVIEIGLQLCSVLRYLHSRQPPIIFRDLKPDNIMRTPDGQLYLIDFGIARHFKQGQAKDTTALGSPGYAAPEQYGKAQSTPRTDIYSLGATLHHLLSGDDPALNPFRFNPLSECEQFVPEDLDRLIQRMLNMDESKRPDDSEVRQELRRIATEWPETKTVAKAATFNGASNTLQQQTGIQAQVPGSFSGAHVVTGWGTGKLSQASTASTSSSSSNTPTKKRGGGRALIVFLIILFAIVNTCSKQSSTTQNNSGDTGITPVKSASLGVLYTFSYAGSRIESVAWSYDGKYIAAGTDGGNVVVWNVQNNTPSTAFVITNHTGIVKAIAWSPDSTLIASAGADATVQVWDIKTRQTVLTYRGHTMVVNALAWSPNGKYIASASDDHTVQVCDARTGQNLLTYRAHTAAVTTVAWSPEGKFVASGGEDHLINIWDANSGKTRSTYVQHAESIAAIAWSPDSSMIASTDTAGYLRIWNVATGADITGEYQGHTIRGLAWSPDGKGLAVGDNTGNISVWNTISWIVNASYKAGDAINSLTWSSDSTMIAFASTSLVTVIT